MEKALSVLAVALLACGCVEARPRHWYTSRQFWVGEGVIIGSVLANRYATCNGYSRGLVEGNFLGHGSTSCGQATAILAVGGGIYTGLHAWEFSLTEDEPSKKWRIFGRVAIPAIACAFHCTAAIREYHMPSAR